MKKLKIKFEKYNLKDKLLLGVLIIDLCIMIWIVFDIVKLPIYDLIIIAVVLNAILVYTYNYYSNKKKKEVIDNKQKEIDNNEGNL